MRAADRLNAGFGEAEVLDLSCFDQLRDRAGDVFDRYIRIDAVLVEQVDRVGPESLQRSLDAALDCLGSAVKAAAVVALQVESELGRDHDLLAYGDECFADEFFVRERAIDLCGVEEGDAALDRRAHERDHLLLIRGRPVAAAHPHAAEADCRDF